MEYSVTDEWEDFETCFLELGKVHYEEVEQDQLGFEYNPNMEMIQQLYLMDAIQLTVAKSEEGNIVGYVCNSIMPSILTSKVTAQEIGMYVRPSVRGCGVLKGLLNVSVKDLKERGVEAHYIAFKKGHEHSVPAGYKETETYYGLEV